MVETGDTDHVGGGGGEGAQGGRGGIPRNPSVVAGAEHRQLEVGSSCQKETQARPTTTPRLERGDRSGICGPGRGLAHSPNTLVFPPLRACSPLAHPM